MPIRVSGAALGEIQDLFHWGAMGVWTDGQLIERFLDGQEGSEAAFRVLIQRHGPMVLGVCRRVLRDEHAAEDAFQATFLVLSKKVGGLRDRARLTNWLYGVALRVSRKERVRRERRREVERQAAERAPLAIDGPEPDDLARLIDEEIRRLPERYRAPLLLCYMEGLRHDEVARRLGCPLGTVESRLSRAREHLRTRLVRRGLEPSATAMVALLRPSRIGAVSTSLVESALRAAMKQPAAEAASLAGAAGLMGRAGRAAVALPFGVRAAAAGIVLALGTAAIGLGLRREDLPSPPPTPPPALVIPADEPPSDSSGRPRAIARPLSGITIDGRLDDWPEGLPRYPIRNQLTHRDEYLGDPVDGPDDLEAEFMAGYDARAGLIYLAVVVRDDELVVRRSDSYLANDAVEVFLDAGRTGRTMAIPTSGDWRAILDAADLPALQYVGIAGDVPAYGDPFGANPSLVYAKARDPLTRMKSRRDGEITTYEWAIRAYDRFPDAPARLEPGKRIGLELAVVDRDPGRPKPAYLTWGPPPVVFKFLDARSFGELLLGGRP